MSTTTNRNTNKDRARKLAEPGAGISKGVS
jgi:hypothetical protein